MVLAHKSAENIKKRTPRFFGSIMSEARVRLAWNAEKAPTDPLVLWSVFKDNNHGNHGMKLAWRIGIDSVGADDERRIDTVTIDGVNPNDVRLAADDGNTAADRLTYALVEHGALMPGELATETDLPGGTVRATLKRHDTLFERMDDGRYRLQGGDTK